MANRVTTSNDPALTYDLLNPGDMFLFGGSAYMKTGHTIGGSYIAVYLATGGIKEFSREIVVTRILHATINSERS